MISLDGLAGKPDLRDLLPGRHHHNPGCPVSGRAHIPWPTSWCTDDRINRLEIDETPLSTPPPGPLTPALSPVGRGRPLDSLRHGLHAGPSRAPSPSPRRGEGARRANEGGACAAEHGPYARSARWCSARSLRSTPHDRKNERAGDPPSIVSRPIVLPVLRRHLEPQGWVHPSTGLSKNAAPGSTRARNRKLQDHRDGTG